MNIKIDFGEQPVKVIEDKNHYKKYLVELFKGISYAMPEEYENNKLIMFRAKVRIKDSLLKLADLPEQLKNMVDVVEQTDIDLEILHKFLKNRLDEEAIVKFLANLIEVYKVVKPGDKIGELEMDYDLFTKFYKMLHYLSFKTKENPAVF